MNDPRLISAHAEGDAAVSGEQGGGVGSPMAVAGMLAMAERGVGQEPPGGLPPQDPDRLNEDNALSPLGRLRW